MQGCNHNNIEIEYNEVIVTSEGVEVQSEVEADTCQDCNAMFYDDLQEWI